MTFEEICKLDPIVLALYQEACSPKDRKDPEFCRTQLWRGLKHERGKVGLLPLLKQRVGWGADGPGARPELHDAETYDICYRKICDAMPACNHAPGEEWTATGPEYLDGEIHGRENTCRYDYPVPPIDPEIQKKVDAGTYIVGERKMEKAGFFSLSAMLRHAAGGPEPTPVDVRNFDDKAEPIFIVQNDEQAWQLYHALELKRRWEEKEISLWYVRNAIMVVDEADSKKIIASNLKKENIIGGLGWKPIVLTFSNPHLSAKLSSIGLAVTEMSAPPESLEEFRTKVAITSPEKNLQLPDMPEGALDSWLGKVCRERMGDFPRALAWPALLAVAGALVDESPIRTNLYVGLIGEVGCGKTSALLKAIWLLGMAPPILLAEKIGSGEGLAKRIGSQGNAARLWFPDELGHTMAKAQIQNATFPETLTSAWNFNQNNAVIARQQVVEFSCRLSIAGGLVTDRFGDAFGSAATGGLWDRFIFGECPTGYAYSHRPDKGQPVRMAPSASDEEEKSVLDLVRLANVDDDVYDERDRWVKVEGINRRVAENALRVAGICAAFDGRATLRAADLGPTLVFAKYQEQMRQLHKPNPGKNESGIVHHTLSEFLNRFSANEEWNEKRKMVQNTHVSDYGMRIVNSVLDSMEADGEIEQKKQGRKPMVRKRI